MLKDAPIVILDEATASVDPENEAELQAAISSLTKGKTLILIAHRLKTVRNADQILVLNGGHIVPVSYTHLEREVAVGRHRPAAGHRLHGGLPGLPDRHADHHRLSGRGLCPRPHRGGCLCGDPCLPVHENPEGSQE